MKMKYVHGPSVIVYNGRMSVNFEKWVKNIFTLKFQSVLLEPFKISLILTFSLTGVLDRESLHKLFSLKNEFIIFIKFSYQILENVERRWAKHTKWQNGKTETSRWNFIIQLKTKFVVRYHIITLASTIENVKTNYELQ